MERNHKLPPANSQQFLLNLLFCFLATGPINKSFQGCGILFYTQSQLTQFFCDASFLLNFFLKIRSNKCKATTRQPPSAKLVEGHCKLFAHLVSC